MAKGLFMSAPQVDSYNVVDYPSVLLPQAHPNRLATLALLFGMQPAPVEKCRLLDIGCGDGGHLLPCAFGMPGSRFVGIDRASVPIERGQQVAATLGLKNVVFECADLLEFPLEGDPFDYIVAHGLYSWVPDVVRDRLLAVCRARLAPHGVAYISYNCYPGGYVRRMLWEMMQFHVQDFEEPGQKLRQAQALVQFLAAGAGDHDEVGKLLHKELERFTDKEVGVVYHDDLAEINEPAYFRQFMDHAGRYGLQFLAEADFHEMQHRIYPPEVSNILDNLNQRDYLLKEQYLDFLKCRRFRQTLLCHQDVRLEREIRPEQVKEFHIVSAARAVSTAPSLAAQSVEEFRGPRGGAMRLDHALSKAALLCLADAWPRSLPYLSLLASARQRLNADPAGQEALARIDAEQDEQALQEVLWAAYSADVLRWQVYQADWPRDLSTCPQLSPLARLELEKGKDLLPTLNFTMMEIEEPFDRQALLLADGTRDQPALVAALSPLVHAARLTLPGKAEPFVVALGARVTQVLQRAAQFGLLVG
jgi:SAM-dependent methyltransferase